MYYNITLLQKFNNCARHAGSQTTDITDHLQHHEGQLEWVPAQHLPGHHTLARSATPLVKILEVIAVEFAWQTNNFEQRNIASVDCCSVGKLSAVRACVRACGDDFLFARNVCTSTTSQLVRLNDDRTDTEARQASDSAGPGGRRIALQSPEQWF